MIFEENSKSLFTSDLFIQPGFNKPVISEDLSDSMIALYRAVGIFASEKPVRITRKKIRKIKSKDDLSNAWVMYRLFHIF